MSGFGKHICIGSEKLEKYILAPYVRAGFQNDILFFGFGSIQQRIVPPEFQKNMLKAASFFKSPRPLEYVEKRLVYEGMDIVTAKTIIHGLLENHLLIAENLYQRHERFSRHILFYNLYECHPEIVQHHISGKHAIVLGCGGIGCMVSSVLAAGGIGKLTLVDGDSVELSNLTRQWIYDEKDVGKRKVDILSRKLHRQQEKLSIDLLPIQIGSRNDLEQLPDADLLILTADTPREILYWVNLFCVDRRMPFLPIGYIQDIVVWGPFVIPGETGCLACRPIISATHSKDSKINMLLQTVNQDYQAPSYGPLNLMAAGCGVLDAFKYLGNFGTIGSQNRRIGIWTNELRIEVQDCSRQTGCPVCSALPSN